MWDDNFIYCEKCGRRVLKRVRTSDSCPDCGGERVSADEYNPTGPHCDVCGKQTKTEGGAKRHKSRVHD